MLKIAWRNMQKFPKMLTTYLLGGNTTLSIFACSTGIDHNRASGGTQLPHFITYTENEPSEFGKAYTLIRKSLLKRHSVVLSSSTSKLLRVTPTKQPEFSMSWPPASKPRHLTCISCQPQPRQVLYVNSWPKKVFVVLPPSTTAR